MKLPDYHLLMVLSGINIPNTHAGSGGKLLGRLQRVTRLPTKYPLWVMPKNPSLHHAWSPHSGT